MDFLWNQYHNGKRVRGSEFCTRHYEHRHRGKGLDIYSWCMLYSMGSLSLQHILVDSLHMGFRSNQADIDMSQCRFVLCR